VNGVLKYFVEKGALYIIETSCRIWPIRMKPLNDKERENLVMNKSMAVAFVAAYVRLPKLG
jgi:hypothetical protein